MHPLSLKADGPILDSMKKGPEGEANSTTTKGGWGQKHRLLQPPHTNTVSPGKHLYSIHTTHAKHTVYGGMLQPNTQASENAWVQG